METPAGYQPEKPALTREQVIEELLRCAEEFPTMPVSHLVAQRLGGIDAVRQVEQLGALDSARDGARPEVGKAYLITTDNWFYGADGQPYRAVFGTVPAVLGDQDTLGIRTNARSSNWYVMIGGMVIAGRQIHYALRTDTCKFERPMREIEHNGELRSVPASLPHVYNADEAACE